MEKKVGDKVWLDGYTSLAQQNSGMEVITKVEYRFDKMIGEKFPIYFIGSGVFDGRDGGAYDNDRSMYYIHLK